MSILRYKMKKCVQYYPVRTKAWKVQTDENGRLAPSELVASTPGTFLSYLSPFHPSNPPTSLKYRQIHTIPQIEPWGKQFFVFNTPLNGKDETLLCVADHSRKPLMFLHKEDFKAVRLYMENIKNELNRLENISRERDSRYEELLLNNLSQSYTMQRMKTGRHSSHTIMRSTLRNKK